MDIGMMFLNMSLTLWYAFLNFMVLGPTIIAYLLNFIYLSILNLYLKVKIGKAYGGLLKYKDVLFFLPDTSRYCIVSVIFIRCSEEINIMKKIKDCLQEKVFDHPDRYPKLTSTYHQFGGFVYRKRCQCNPNDVLRTIPVEDDQEITEDYLKRYAAKVMNAKFGKNDTLLWEIQIADRPMRDKLNGDYIYPVIKRFHHAIADGTSLVSWEIQVFGGQSVNENYNEQLFGKLLNNQETKEKRKADIIKSLKQIFGGILLHLEILFISYGRLLTQYYFKPKDKNALMSEHLREKVCVWTCEEKVECIPLVKNIKNNENTKFSCVVLTAIAASFSQYFKRNNFPIPNNMSGYIVALLEPPDVDLTKPIDLTNNMVAPPFELPMVQESTNLLDTLKLISKRWHSKKRIADSMLLNYIRKYATPVHLQLLKLYVTFESSTYLLTNVPGGSMEETQDKWIYDKIIAIAPHVLGISVSISIVSYNNKFQIGLMVDKSIVKSQEEIQQISDDILLNIKLLYKQMNAAAK